MDPASMTPQAQRARARTHQLTLIEQLPTSLLSQIASLCKGASKKAFRATCRTFRAAAGIPSAIHLEAPQYMCESTAHFKHFRKFIEANPQISTVHMPDRDGGAVYQGLIAMMLPLWDGIQLAHLPSSPLSLVVGLVSWHTHITSLTLGDPHGGVAGDLQCHFEIIHECTALRELSVTLWQGREGEKAECEHIGEMTQLKKLSIYTRPSSRSWFSLGSTAVVPHLNKAISTLTQLSELKVDSHTQEMSEAALDLQQLTNLKSFTWACREMEGSMPANFFAGLSCAGAGLTKLVCHRLQPLQVLKKLTGLVHLEVERDGGDWEQLSEQIIECCPNVTYLSIPGLTFGDGQRGVCLPSLEYLCVSRFVVGDFQTCACIPNLQHLCVDRLMSERPLSQVAPGLKILETSHNQSLPSSCIVDHPTLAELHMCLDDLLLTKLVLEDLKSVKTLRHLVLRGRSRDFAKRRFTDQEPSILWDMFYAQPFLMRDEDIHSSVQHGGTKEASAAGTSTVSSASLSVLSQVTRLHITCFEPFGQPQDFAPLLARLPSLTNIRFHSEKPIDATRYKFKKQRGERGYMSSREKEPPPQYSPGIAKSLGRLAPTLCKLPHLEVIEMDASVMVAGQVQWRKAWGKNPKDESEGHCTGLSGDHEGVLRPWSQARWYPDEDERGELEREEEDDEWLMRINNSTETDSGEESDVEDDIKDKFLCRFLAGLIQSESLSKVVLVPGGESFEDVRYHKNGTFRHAVRLEAHFQGLLADIHVEEVHDVVRSDCYQLCFH